MMTSLLWVLWRFPESHNTKYVFSKLCYPVTQSPTWHLPDRWSVGAFCSHVTQSANMVASVSDRWQWCNSTILAELPHQLTISLSFNRDIMNVFIVGGFHIWYPSNIIQTGNLVRISPWVISLHFHVHHTTHHCQYPRDPHHHGLPRSHHHHGHLGNCDLTMIVL